MLTVIWNVAEIRPFGDTSGEFKIYIVNFSFCTNIFIMLENDSWRKLEMYTNRNVISINFHECFASWRHIKSSEIPPEYFDTHLEIRTHRHPTIGRGSTEPPTMWSTRFIWLSERWRTNNAMLSRTTKSYVNSCYLRSVYSFLLPDFLQNKKKKKNSVLCFFRKLLTACARTCRTNGT